MGKDEEGGGRSSKELSPRPLDEVDVARVL